MWWKIWAMSKWSMACWEISKCWRGSMRGPPFTREMISSCISTCSASISSTQRPNAASPRAHQRQSQSRRSYRKQRPRPSSGLKRLKRSKRWKLSRKWKRLSPRLKRHSLLRSSSFLVNLQKLPQFTALGQQRVDRVKGAVQHRGLAGVAQRVIQRGLFQTDLKARLDAHLPFAIQHTQVHFQRIGFAGEIGAQQGNGWQVVTLVPVAGGVFQTDFCVGALAHEPFMGEQVAVKLAGKLAWNGDAQHRLNALLIPARAHGFCLGRWGDCLRVVCVRGIVPVNIAHGIA